MNPARRRVRVRGEAVDAHRQEFRLLHLLLSHSRVVLAAEALLYRVWPNHTHVTPVQHESLVKRLRRAGLRGVARARPALVLSDMGQRMQVTRCLEQTHAYGSLYWRRSNWPGLHRPAGDDACGTGGVDSRV